ncbi:MAG: HIRAN domain-containing protein [Bacteroidales bacterium]|nr:HIRAN domain-containing protein [Bacteroidales bacterium]
MERRHFTHFNIAGFTYYDGPIALSELKIGSRLQLVFEPENKYDPKAVTIFFNSYKLGYVPRNENSAISKLLEMGYNIFDTRIQRLDTTTAPEEQVGVIVYLVNANGVHK